MTSSLRAVRIGIAALLIGSLGVAHGQPQPLLRYVFDAPGNQQDLGTPPPANGMLAGGADRITESPSSFSCGSLDLTANNANHNYLTTGADVQKIDALPAMTATFWLNLQGDPAVEDCLLSDMPPGFPPFGTGGWELRIIGAATPLTASNFQLSFWVLQAFGTFNYIESSTSPSINADNRWVFVAVSFDGQRVQRYYFGTETTSMTQIGFSTTFSFFITDNLAEFRVGSASSEPAIDRTPPAWIDDVRIYGEALNTLQLEQIRLENLQGPIPSGAPTFFVLNHPLTKCLASGEGISPDGSTVLGFGVGPNGLEGFRWKDSTLTPLGDLPGGSFSSIAYAASADGSVVVGNSASENSFQEAFRWENGVMEGLGDLPGGDFNSAAFGVSGDGSVVVGWSVDRPGNLLNGFRWEAGVMEPLGFLPGYDESVALDITRDGEVIVGISGTGFALQSSEAFRWENGVMEGLGDLPGGTVSSGARKIAGNKQVIAGWGRSDSGQEATCWRYGRIIGLGDLPGGNFQSEARAVSRHGSYIVGRGMTAAGEEAFIWDRYNGMRNLRTVLTNDHGLDLTGWRLSATGISDDGSVITGHGFNPVDLRQAWAARLPLSPAMGDFDGDGDVDGDDVDLFAACATGADVPYDPANLPPGCILPVDLYDILAPDLDEDGDVDSDDFGILQQCYGGQGQPAPEWCRG